MHAGKTAPAAPSQFDEGNKKNNIPKTQETFNCLRTGRESPFGGHNRERKEQPAVQTVAQHNFKQIMHTARGDREKAGY